MPALSESAEYVTIIGTTHGVLSALDVGRMVQIYANQTIHPVRANGTVSYTHLTLPTICSV
eukprot:7174965-Alexandrium_andersonii.AAC.1